jgi:uncharacterized membrane protein YdjX (TVP38/TMEM64 family)
MVHNSCAGMESATRRQLLGVASLLAVAAIAAVVVSPSRVVGRLEGLADQPALFVAVVALVYLVRPFVLWPVSIVAVALGYLYGVALAFPVAILGSLLTGTPPYLLGRYARTDAGLFGTVSSSGERLVRAVGETRGVVAARFSPIPGDPISYGSGIAGVSPRAFYLGTAVGEVPWAAVAVVTGASMRELSASGLPHSPALLVALAGLAVLTLGSSVYGRVRTDRSGAAGE